MAMISPAILTALNTGVSAAFADGYANLKVPPFWKDIASLVLSKNSSNTYGWLGDFPRLREWIGPRVVKDMKASGYSITNKLFEDTVGVARTSIEDDDYGFYAPMSRHMGQAAAEHPDILVNDALLDGETSLCFDGQFFFDTDHPVFPNADGTGVATTWGNFVTGAGERWYLFDTSKSLLPLIFQERTKPELEMKFDPSTSDTVFNLDEFRWGIRYRCAVGYGFPHLAHCARTTLDAANFQAYRTKMRLLKADGGRPLGVVPDTIMVGPSNEAAAKALFETQYLVNGGSNPNYNAVKIIVNSRMG